jgi:hypothetical protein
MKKFNALYFILFILLVMGAFASMAQNSYGPKIMGGVAFSFGLLFIAEFVITIGRKGKEDLLTKVEPVCLFILSFIFGLRVFYIHFNYVELLFGVAAVLLAILYIRKMILRYHQFQEKSNVLSILIVVFHLSIVLFLVSLALVPFYPKLAEATGIGSFALLLIYVITGFLKKKLLVEGEAVSAFDLLKQYKGHSIIIITLIVMFSFYIGFNKLGILPGIYSDEFPRAYFELVNKAASGKEKSSEGKFKYELFKEKYDQFIKHNKDYGK